MSRASWWVVLACATVFVLAQESECGKQELSCVLEFSKCKPSSTAALCECYNKAFSCYRKKAAPVCPPHSDSYESFVNGCNNAGCPNCPLPLTGPGDVYYAIAKDGALEHFDLANANGTEYGTRQPGTLCQGLSTLVPKPAYPDDALAYALGYQSSNYSFFLESREVGDGSVKKVVWFSDWPLFGFAGSFYGQKLASNPKTGEVYIIVPDKEYISNVFSLAAASSTLRKIGSTDYPMVNWGACAFDADAQVLWGSFNLTAKGKGVVWLAFDVKTGQVVHELEDTFGVSTLNYNSRTKKCYGIGSDNANGVRVFVSLDASTGTWQKISELPAYGLLANRLAAVDSWTGKYSVVMRLMQRPGKLRTVQAISSEGEDEMLVDVHDGSVVDHNEVGDMYLVTLDVSSGKVLSDVKICDTTMSQCPWSLLFNRS